MSEVEYEIGSSEEEIHDASIEIPERQEVQYSLTPELAQRFLVDNQPVPKEYLQDYEKNFLSKPLGPIPGGKFQSASSDEGQLSDSDFLNSDESVPEHDRDVTVVDADKSNDPLAQQKFIVPESMDKSFKEISKSAQESISSGPKEPVIITKRAAAAALAAFAFASYKTFFTIPKRSVLQTPVA
ncbi:hypothetical protein TRFO_09343 [Tritrichomonas foetus]|uniref:Uncharacterized protein n=1 Tax=Tritrichomonas foetus TaxID=1144522 RepID=A0A1J4JJ92_9EUKA|nr:hypothetical protein TRFO_09343 [Tritrichomonas foetus]|eukprot:OHS97637.1 hypothetical protein TRFO_09343 [Tritrichomonas foetus]